MNASIPWAPSGRKRQSPLSIVFSSGYYTNPAPRIFIFDNIFKIFVTDINIRTSQEFLCITFLNDGPDYSPVIVEGRHWGRRKEAQVEPGVS